MKFPVVLLAGLAFMAVSGPTFADTKNDAAATASGPSATVDPKPSTDTAYPRTFACAHCGLKITAKSEKDMKKDCAQCACGMKNADCAPKPSAKDKKANAKVKPVAPQSTAKPADPAVTAKPADPPANAKPADPQVTAKPVEPVAKADPKAGPDVKYPTTFTCAHCGLKLTVKSEKDWQKDCDQCACGMKYVDCLPKRKS